MTAETYYVGAYWGVRRESAGECAHRARVLFECLAQCDPLFARWLKRGQSRKAALKHEIEPHEASLRKLLLAGRNRTDFGGEVIDELGFRLSLWNDGGSDEESVGLTISCGTYAPIPGVNSCVINLPYQGAAAERILRVPVLVAVMNCIVSTWEPDWGVVISNTYLNTTPSALDNRPHMGWMVYLSRQRGVIPPLPPPVQVLPIGTQGSVIVITNDRFTAGNPTHTEIADQAAKMLNQAGLLGPLR